MSRPPSIQWYYKQWLGDNKVLAMDWDAQAMHFHLLMMSIQENPAGSIPNDVGQIRRWLRLPSGQSDSDRVWARVQPQIFAAWTLTDERWFNSGMVATLERAENYRNRYETGTKKARDSMKTEEEVVIKSFKESETTNLEQATQFLFMEMGLAGLQNRVKCQDAVRAYVHWSKKDELVSAEELAGSWKRYRESNVKYRTNAVGFLEKAVWKDEETWTQKKSANSMGGW